MLTDAARAGEAGKEYTRRETVKIKQIVALDSPAPRSRFPDCKSGGWALALAAERRCCVCTRRPHADRRSLEIASQSRALFPAALTRPRALRVPQLSLEAHARELFGAGPLGYARRGSRAVLAARDLPLGDPHGQEGGGAPGSTHPETWRKQTRDRAHTWAERGRGWRKGRGLEGKVDGRGGACEKRGPAEIR